MKKMLLTSVVCAAGLTLFAGEGKSGNNRWIGGASGDFNDPAKWEKGVPDTDETMIVDSDTPVTINMPEGVWKVWGLSIGTAASAPDAPTDAPVTFTGSGTLVSEQQSNVYTNRWLVFDGANYSAQYHWMKGPSRFEIKNGSKLRFADAEGSLYKVGLSVSADSTFAVSGGDVYLRELAFAAGSHFVMDAGRCEVYEKNITAGEGVTCDFTGGTFVSAAILSDNELLFNSGRGEMLTPKGASATLIVKSSYDNAYATSTAVAGKVYVVGGTLNVTNGTLILNKPGSVQQLTTLSGRGKIWANKITLEAPYLTCQTYHDLDVSELFLGNLLYAGGSTYANRLCLWNAAKLGFFGGATSGTRSSTVEALGQLTVDTADCFDSSKAAHTVSFESAAIYPRGVADLSVIGGGSFATCVKDRHQRWNVLSVGANTTLGVNNGSVYEIGGYRPQVNARTLNLAAGSTLNVTAYTGPVDTRTIGTIAPTAKIVPALPSTFAGSPMAVLTTDDLTADLADIAVDVSALSAWQLKRSPGVIYIEDDTPELAKIDDWEWTGAKSGYWNDAENWNGGEVPKWDKTRTVYFSGKNVCVTNDFGRQQVAVQCLRFRPGGPYRLCGSEIIVDGSGGAGWTSSTILSESSLPVILDCDLNHGAVSSSGLGITAYSNSYIRVNGTVTATDNLSIAGDIRFAGAVTCKRFTPVQNRGWDAAANRGRDGRCTSMTLLPGASFEASGVSQDISCPYFFDLDIETNATFLVSGGTRYFWKTYPHDYFVNGTFDCRIPFGGETTMNVDGTGTVYLASTISATANCEVSFGGGIRVIPAAWHTVTDSANPGKFIRPVVTTEATFGATNDWTYGVADGVTPTTTADARALNVLRPLSTATVDTQDPATSEGHTVTFADPIVGYGKVVKTGAGTLCLASDANAVTGGVTVAAGTLAWTEPQTFTKLTAASGSTLAFGAKSGEPVVATVKGDLDLTGVNVVPYDSAAKVALGSAYATVLRVEGEITGLPSTGNYRYRVKDGALQMKVNGGLFLIFK